MANEVVFKGMVKFINRNRPQGQPSRRMRLVMNNDLTKGGHLSSQPMGALFNFVEEDPATGKERVVNFPVLADNPYKPDLQKLAENCWKQTGPSSWSSARACSFIRNPSSSSPTSSRTGRRSR